MTLANPNAPKPANLFDLTSDWHELQIKLSDFDGEISDEDKEAEIDQLFADIAENQDQLETKVDGYIAMMATFEARAELRHREAARLKALADRDQKQFDWLEGRLETFLKVINRKDFQTAYHHLKFKKAGGKRAITWNDGPVGVLHDYAEQIPNADELGRIIVAALRALDAQDTVAYAEIADRLNTFLWNTEYTTIDDLLSGTENFRKLADDLAVPPDLIAAKSPEINVLPNRFTVNKDAVREYLEVRELAPPHERRTDLPFATLEPRKETLVIK